LEDYEIIVIDDGSQDDTSLVMDGYRENKKSVISLKRTKGSRKRKTEELRKAKVS